MEDQGLKRRRRMRRKKKSSIVEQIFPAACGDPSQPWRKVWRRSNREEVLWTHYNPHLLSSSAPLWRGGGRGVGDEGVRLSLGIGGGKVLFYCFSLCFLLPKSCLIGNKLVFPMWSLFCPWWWLVSDLPDFISSHELSCSCFFPVFSPVPTEKGEGVQLGGSLIVGQG